MIKKFTLLSFIFLCFCFAANSQTLDEAEKNNFEFLVSYGPAYNAFNKGSADDKTNIISLQTPALGTFMELNIDYSLSRNRFLGLGYSNQVHSIRIDNMNPSNSFGLLLDNYVSKYTKHFYDLHFRKEFQSHFHLTVGLFYNVYAFSSLDSVMADGRVYPLLRNDKMKGDEFGISLSGDYYFPIRDYFEIGIRGKVFYSLVEIESVSLAPILKFRF